MSNEVLQRPTLTNLNGDNSWLMSFPRPAADAKSGANAFFHVVIDPWLYGSATQFSSYILHFKRPVAAGVPDVPAIEATIRQIEKSVTGANCNENSPPRVNAIVVSALAPDHCHLPTLAEFPRNTPVFAASNATGTIRGMNHFDTIIPLKAFAGAKDQPPWQQAHPGPPLPKWLTVFDLPAAGVASFCLAIISSAVEGRHELILFTPHGILPTTPSLLALLDQSTPSLQTLALMHPLKEFWTFGIKNVLGARNALAMQRTARPRYWVETADAPLILSGVLTWFATESLRTLQWGIDEDEKAGLMGKGKENRPNYIKVENGGRFVLD